MVENLKDQASNPSFGGQRSADDALHGQSAAQSWMCEPTSNLLNVHPIPPPPPQFKTPFI